MTNATSRRREWARRAPALLAGLTLPLAGAALAAPTQHVPTAAPSDRAVARTLAQKPASGWSSVILKTTGALTPAQEARVRTLGGDITRRLPIISSVAVRVPSRNLGKLAALPFVTHLSLDGSVQKSDDGENNDAAAVANSYGFTTTSSEDDVAYWQYGLTGRGVTVAVIDSGVVPSADLKGSSPVQQFSVPGPRILANYVLAPPAVAVQGAPPPPAADPCGHGTHVAGIIAGNGARSTDSNSFLHFFGIAPSTNLVNVRVLDQNGRTDVSTVIAGLQWVVANKTKYNIRVVNLSLGHPVGESYTTDPLCQAVETAWKAGIAVVCAAGNNGRFGAVNVSGASNEGWGTAYGSIQSPANDPYVITVGAAKRNLNPDGTADTNRAHDRIATYSSRGPSRVDLVLKPDIIAPGNKVISLDASGSALDTYAGGTNTIPQSLYKYVKSGDLISRDYFCLSGTSMAVVAGAAALLLQADPTLTPDTIKARLMLSADKWTAPDGTGDALTYGAGYLNIPAALANTAKAGLPALSPTLMVNSDGTLSLVMDRAAWGSTALAGSRAAWGSGLWGTGITDLRAAWGSSVGADRAAWGSTTNADGSVSLFMDRAAWGSTALTADRAAWGSTATSADRAAWGSGLASADRAAWGSRVAWGSSSPSVDLTSTAITGE